MSSDSVDVEGLPNGSAVDVGAAPNTEATNASDKEAQSASDVDVNAGAKASTREATSSEGFSLPALLRQAGSAIGDISATHVFVAWIVSVFVAVWVLEGGLLHPEIRVRMPLYLRHASLFSIIFDAAQDTIPRPRQISFIFDVVDAYFIQACSRRGYPHFLSFTHHVFSLFIMLSLWRFMNRYVTKNRGISLLFIMTVLFSRAFELAAIFRTAKIGAALSIALMINVLADLLTHPLQWRRKSLELAGWAAILFVLAIVGALFDEQSIALTLVVTVVLVGWSILRRNAACAAGAAGAAVGLGFTGAYYRWIFPKIYLSVNHVSMTYDFQTSVPNDVLTNGKIYWDSLELMLDTAGCLLGNLTRSQVIAGIVCVVGIWVVHSKNALRAREAGMGEISSTGTATGLLVKPADGWAVLLFLLALGALWVLNVGLVLKHPAVLWADVRIAYYWLPAATCIAFLVPWIVARIDLLFSPTVPGRRATLAIGVLVLFVGSNLMALPDHLATLKSGHIAPDFAATKQLLPALKDPVKAREVYGREPVNDPIYMLLKNRHPPTH